MFHQSDHLVIGSGLAGLSLALKLAEKENVLLITKGFLQDSNSYYAQGGIASVLAKEDSFAQHIDDTLVAGCGLNHQDIVKLVIESGPKVIDGLVKLGVPFTKEHDSSYHLTKEGGHSQRRVLHSHDFTGRALIDTLLRAIKQSPRITVFESMYAIDLITTDKSAPRFGENHCLGAYALELGSGKVWTLLGRQTFLCTGGHGRVYQHTTNPEGATADGLAMAWRAGCKIANLEFMQFHPTCFYRPGHPPFLISEALRGEGGILKTYDGISFMEDYHPQSSLAPRDVVARAIDTELKKSGRPCIYLDIRHIGKDKIQELFPTIYQHCLNSGLDISQAMIPVVPAAHYSCGGVVVDSWGQTNISGLYAVGEVACTGLHGANRLASNSLLEACVFADRAAIHALQNKYSTPMPTHVSPWNDGETLPHDELVLLSHTWDEIRRLMWNYVGIVRSERRLKKALSRMSVIKQELDEYYWGFRIIKEVIELRNIADSAWLTIRCAMKRRESRGIHYNLDYPTAQEQAFDTILTH